MTRLLATGSAAAMLFALSVQADAAQTNLTAGGGTLASLVYRDIFDSYANRLGGGVTLPKGASSRYRTDAEIAYAAVGSGQGRVSLYGDAPGQLYFQTNPYTAGVTPPAQLPQSDPAYSDSNISFPYARLSFAAGDATFDTDTSASNTVPLSKVALAQNTTTLQADTASATYTAQFIPATSLQPHPSVYDTTNWGSPANTPAFLTSIAVPVNAGSLNNIQAKTEVLPNSKNTAVISIELTRGAYLAIFAGKVTNWNDNTTTFVGVKGTAASGTIAAHTATFVETLGNSNNGKPFSTTSLPITVVYRGDKSGTSAIFTQHLVDVGNPLGYAFAATDNFGAKDVFAGETATPAIGTLALAEAITTTAGAIGYASPDVTYSYYNDGVGQTLPNGNVAPVAASLESAYNLSVAQNTPNHTNYFNQPTTAALAIDGNSLPIPASGANYTAWDLNTTFDVALQNVTAGTTIKGEYPIAGVTYFYTYGVLNSSRTAELKALLVSKTSTGTTKIGFFPWYYGGTASGTTNGTNATVKNILTLHGFQQLPSKLVTLIYNDFFNQVTTTVNTRSLAGSANGA